MEYLVMYIIELPVDFEVKAKKDMLHTFIFEHDSIPEFVRRIIYTSRCL